MDHGQVDEGWFPSRCVCEEVEGDCFALTIVAPVMHVFYCLDLVC